MDWKYRAMIGLKSAIEGTWRVDAVVPDMRSYPAVPGRVSGVAAAKRAARKRKNRSRK